MTSKVLAEKNFPYVGDDRYEKGKSLDVELLSDGGICLGIDNKDGGYDSQGSYDTFTLNAHQVNELREFLS